MMAASSPKIRRPIITATMLRWFNTCDRRIWLDTFGDPSKRVSLDRIQTYQLMEGIRHEEHVHAATAPDAIILQPKTWASAVKQTRTIMQQGASAILGACLEVSLPLGDLNTPFTLRGRVDRLIRQSEPVQISGGKPTWNYSPVEIKVYSSLNPNDFLQLDFYIFLLGQIQGSFPQGEFWLGRTSDDLPETIQSHHLDKDRLLGMLSQIAHLLTSATAEPSVMLKKACRFCHWRAPCRVIAEQNHDIYVLPGLRPSTCEQLRAAGITTLDHLITLEPENLRQFKGIDTTAKKIHASARAWISKAPAWYQSLPEYLQTGGWLFDIETIMPDNKAVWCITWSDTNGTAPHTLMVDPEGTSDHYPVADETLIRVSDPDAAWREFARHMGDTRPIFHWGAFDNTVMSKYAPADARSQLQGRLYNLCKIFDSVVRCPIQNSSLKTVAPYLGFRWQSYQDPFSAFDDYYHWLSRRDPRALERARRYSGDDVQALFIVWKWLVENAPN